MRTQFEQGSAMVCRAIASVLNDKPGGMGSNSRKSPTRRQSRLCCTRVKMPVKNQIHARVAGGAWKITSAPTAKTSRADASSR